MAEPTRVEKIVVALGLKVERARGDRVWARCPFHKDESRTPRFFIRRSGPRAGQTHCFVCKNGGTLVDLVKHVRGYGTDRAANEWLKNWKDSPPPAPAAVRMEVPALGRREFRLPGGTRVEPLVRWVGGARNYARSRGLTDDQVERWGIGYAPEGRLEGRIVIPVRDRLFRPVSYMARTWCDQQPRYLYPRTEDGPDLDGLFGEEFWPTRALRDRVYLTEGALKSLAIERVAPAYFHVALGGSQIRPLHVAKLATWRQVVVFSDGDVAGDLVREEIHLALARHTQILDVRMEPGKDPDSISPEELRACLSLLPPPTSADCSSPTARSARAW